MHINLTSVSLLEIVALKDIQDEEIRLSADDLYRNHQADLFFPYAKLRKRLSKKPEFMQFYQGICIGEDQRRDFLTIMDGSGVCGIAYIQYSGFETGIFEKKMGTLHVKVKNDVHIPVEQVKTLVGAITALAKDDGYEHISIRVPPHAASLISSLQGCGYDYIASLVTFVYARHEASVKRLKNLYRVRTATQNDKSRVLELSESGFSGTRFTNDPSLDKRKCSQLYREWVRRCFDSGWASNIFVAVSSQDKIMGFLTYLIDAELKEKGEITKLGRGMAACDPTAKGAYISLIQTSLDLDLQKTGADFIEYTIPLENLELMKVYNRLGFALGKIDHTFRKEF